MKTLIKILLTLICATQLLSCKQEQQSSNEIVVGIIEPLSHTAMNEIAAGFSDTLHALYKKPVTIKIENAQNDPNLQRAIIQKMADAHYNLIVPIGVGATSMSLAMVHDIPIVSLASDLTDEQRKKIHPCHAAAVHDEISSQQILEFIHAVYPKLTELTLVHSAADKVFPEVDATVNAGKKLGINIHHVMVASLPELYRTAESLPSNTQAIFILKDSMIASGIGTLAKAAASLHIPLITSDQGSVQDGAGFSLGVHEKNIGIEGGKLAAAVLDGKSICELPIVTMKNLTVFINKKSLQAESQTIDSILKTAKTFHYQVEIVDKTGSTA